MPDSEDRRPGRPKPWFKAKRYGYGAGLPIAWQGWALLFGFLVVLISLMPLFIHFMNEGSIFAILPVAVMIGAVVMLFRICEQRSDKNWQWRWGDDE